MQSRARSGSGSQAAHGSGFHTALGCSLGCARGSWDVAPMQPIASLVASRQDGLLTRTQALQQLTRDELTARLGKHWPVVLPGVYLTTQGVPTLRQRRRAALLKAGSTAMLTDLDALDLYGLPNLPVDPFVRVLIANDVKRTSRDFLVICRTKRLPQANVVAGLRSAPLARALADFVLRHGDERESLAVAAAAVQRRLVSPCPEVPFSCIT